MRDRNQVVLPFNYEKNISEKDPVRKLIEICEELDYTELFETYVRTWRKHNPITLFEIIVYGYMQGKYSAREIEEACINDIRFMWILNGEPVPDYSTIARFQSKRLEKVIERLFYQLVEKLYEMGEVRFKNVFIDGTKIEANANKYTFVWRKAVEKSDRKLREKIAKELPVIAARYGIYENITIEECYQVLLNQAELINLLFVEGSGKRKTQLQKDIENLGEYLSRLGKYTMQTEICGNRKSFSKTDIDATFMRLKDDAMKNGQLKPAYNVQIGVESEYIVGVGIFSNPTDVNTLIPFLKRMRSHTRRKIEQIIADAGYESRENYLYLKENGQKSFIKPQNYEISKTRRYKNNKYRVENMRYDEEHDHYVCENGEVLFFAYETEETTSAGYKVKVRYYRNQSCEGCPHMGKCHRSTRGFREIKVSPEFIRDRAQSLENITSEEGDLLRTNRSIQVEGVFGVLKQDYRFRRFLTRGKSNVETQFFLLSFAFNIQKLCNRLESGRFGQDLFPLKTKAA
ncbi:MAG: IS1182 family transposase [Clostridia bacterium]|nr:IS1182 family transposase [Clostridia bacterium]